MGDGRQVGPEARLRLANLIELQFALWLESQSHTIVGLEATRGGADIETRSANGQANAFELKFIGMEDEDFMLLVRSMGGHPKGGPLSPYRPINVLKLLFGLGGEVYFHALRLRENRPAGNAVLNREPLRRGRLYTMKQIEMRVLDIEPDLFAHCYDENGNYIDPETGELEQAA